MTLTFGPLRLEAGRAQTISYDWEWYLLVALGKPSVARPKGHRRIVFTAKSWLA